MLLLLSEMNTNLQIPTSNGATQGTWDIGQREEERILNDIKVFIQGIGSGFKNILRMNQSNNRYKYISMIISYPKKKSIQYQGSKIIGLFYEDKYPEDNIRFKQDLILHNSSSYTFIIGESWFQKFPNLSQYKSYIWNFEKFDGEIANKVHFKNNGKFNHYYKSISSLPLQVANHYRQSYHLLIKSTQE
jgi:hypothetical protein